VNLAMGVLDICAISRLEHDAAPGYRGIPEPGAHCESPRCRKHRLRVVLAWRSIALATESATGRLLRQAAAAAARDAHRVAGAFRLQLVDHVPAASHDVALDAVVTEARSISIAR
jgi:hypothetical protein